MWTETDVDIMTEGDFDPDIGEDSILDLDTEPLRYEDYLRRYLEGDTDFSALKKEPEIMQEAAPKSKEQIISELAPKIAKPGITPGRATIEAQRLYTDVERIFGSNADAVLEMFQPGQEPRKFLDGVKTAYLSGKMGSRAALENSGVAAFLTDEQRSLAYELGVQQNGVPELVSTNEKPYISSLDQKKDIRKGHLAKSEEFATIRDKDMVILEERLLELPIQERMEELDEVLRFYTDRKSGWKGVTYISPIEQMGDTTGRKNWDCSIELREDAGIKTSIHELLHARSISFWNRLAYSRWENAEEAAVELFARKICEKNGVNYKPAYSKIVGQLEIAGRILYPNRDQYEFAKAFFEQDVINRYSWLREQADILISKGVLSEKTIDILNTAIDTFKRRI